MNEKKTIFLIFILLSFFTFSGCGKGEKEEAGSEYKIGGTINGLNGSLTVQNNGKNNQDIDSNGAFFFSDSGTSGETYEVTISKQPDIQLCEISNATGTISTSNITNIEITCSNVLTDTNAPIVTFTSNNTSNSENYLLKGTFSDDFGVTSLVYTLNNSNPQTIDPLQTPFSINLTLLEGENIIVVTASDAAQNIGQAETKVIYNVTQTSDITSEELIEQALENGDIDQETALIYKVFAEFGDNRLPVELQGEDSNEVTSDGLTEVLNYARNNILSNEFEETIWPFLIPPYFEGSWFDAEQPGPNLKQGLRPRGVGDKCKPWLETCVISELWKSVEGSNVVVWYKATYTSTDQTKAEMLVNEFDGTIWPKLTGLMGPPLPDTCCLISESDPRYDIVLTDHLSPKKEGMTTITDLYGCEKESAFSYLNRNLSDTALKAQTAHEFMHGIQYKYNVCPDKFKTVQESTATWATEYVYPDNNWEHRYADNYLNNITESIDWLGDPLFPYGAYLFILYSHIVAGETVIPDIWQSLVQTKDQLKAIDQALQSASTSLDKVWPEFAVQSWNRYPSILFQTIDDMIVQPPPNDPQTLGTNGLQQGKVDISLEIKHMSADYYHLKFSDNTMRSLTFFNGLSFKLAQTELVPGMGKQFVLQQPGNDLKSGRHVHALLKINDLWREKAIDLSNVPFTHFCRDSKVGKLDEIVLIFSNSQHDKNHTNYQSIKELGDPSTLWFSNIGCYQWSGNVNFEKQENGLTEKLTISNLEFTNIFTLDTPTTTSATPANLSKAMVPGEELPVPFGYGYKITKGTAQWSLSGTEGSDPRCTHNGSKTFDISGNIPILTTSNWSPDGGALRGAWLPTLFANNIFEVNSLPVDEHCVYKDGTIEDGIYPHSIGIDIELKMNDKKIRVDSSGMNLSGNHEQTSDPIFTTGSWNLNSLPEAN